MGVKPTVYKVKAYIEYEIEAESEDEAIDRLTECIQNDLEESQNIRDIAEIATEVIEEDLED